MCVEVSLVVAVCVCVCMGFCGLDVWNVSGPLTQHVSHQKPTQECWVDGFIVPHK